MDDFESEIDILDLPYWPTPQSLSLDDSQYKAMQTALTKEFVVIQGPPGTVKTFIDVLILQMLLGNERARSSADKFGIILIVCYTNNALDQFLES